MAERAAIAIAAIVLFSRPSDTEHEGDVAHAPATAAVAGIASGRSLLPSSSKCFASQNVTCSDTRSRWPPSQRRPIP